jgi:hypothetical protein
MTDHTLGDAPIEAQYRAQMLELANFLDEYLNGPKPLRKGEPKHGFVLLMFQFGDGGRANYISNADRRDVTTLLKEQLARFEGQPEMKGRG